MIRAISFDYWDTLYHGAPDPARATLRQNAIRRLMRTLGHAVDDAELMAVYRASGAEADRWWREEHRGYTGAERVHWMLRRLGIERPEDCEHVTAACAEVDASLVTLPPPLIDGARQVVETLHRHPQIAALAIVSDSGFASGRGQDRLLEHDQLLDYFPVRIYSCDVGHAKPHARPFQAAVDALGVRPEEVLHIGDNERTDVEGALRAGLRAVRADFVRRNGSSVAEFVAGSHEELSEYLESVLDGG
ncbi:MAG TPA: HAD family hydrolase [Gemmatimonadaceae bacterium]|nr:HAD family hydrolase [Gemmatimonadaceae bacterium]